MTVAQQTLSVLVAIAALAIFVWLLIAPRKSADDNAVINPSDPRQLALLIGMTGGSIADAAVAQHALRRFEEQHGRKATVRDMATVAGMMTSSR